jgi:hypothetical protein
MHQLPQQPFDTQTITLDPGIPDQLQHQSRLLFLLIWQHLQPMMTMLQSANELQHWKKPKQLHHQRDPSVATDYYIQSTEQEPMSGQAEVKRL